MVAFNSLAGASNFAGQCGLHGLQFVIRETFREARRMAGPAGGRMPDIRSGAAGGVAGGFNAVQKLFTRQDDKDDNQRITSASQPAQLRDTSGESLPTGLAVSGRIGAKRLASGPPLVGQTARRGEAFPYTA